MNLMNILWGEGEHLSVLQMSIRSFAMFFIALCLIRLGGMRIFGKKSAMDTIVVIMLGAIMARGIVGASPFMAVVVASAVMIFINRILAWACGKNKLFNRLIKGNSIILYQSDEIKWNNMKLSNLSESDLKEGLRLETNSESFKDIDKILLENNGRISFILKANK